MIKPVGIILVMAITLLGACTSTSPTDDEVRKFYDNFNKEHLVLTKLKYYIHADFGAGPNRTVLQVTSPDISGFNFGRILVMDNKLTVSPDPNSQYMGQYQGMNAYSDFNEAALTMNMNFIFHGGTYDGSTISIMGRQSMHEEVRVLSVIGGTGVFRLARGTALASTYSADPITNSGVYLYEMFVVTPTVGRSRKEV